MMMLWRRKKPSNAQKRLRSAKGEEPNCHAVHKLVDDIFTQGYPQLTFHCLLEEHLRSQTIGLSSL
jgi:hypothetical protein